MCSSDLSVPSQAGRGRPDLGPDTDRRLVLAAAVGAGALLWANFARGATAQVVRLHDHNTHTRLVVELSGPVEFKVRRFADPYRLSVDVPGLEWSGEDNAAGAGLISNVQFVRQGSVSPSISIALKGPVKVARSFVLPATGTTPTRLVIDVESSTREVFLAGAEAPAKAVPVAVKIGRAHV